MRIFFPRKRSYGHFKGNLLTPLEQVPWKAKIFRVDVQQGLENFFF